MVRCRYCQSQHTNEEWDKATSNSDLIIFMTSIDNINEGVMDRSKFVCPTCSSTMYIEKEDIIEEELNNDYIIEY
ncbi:MAG: hypothetical protein ACOCRK_06445 [bacterium]